MRVSTRHRIIALVFGLFLVFSIRAEELNNKFLQTQWKTEDGLPQNSISAMAQTPDGYLWIGTFGGLARFDGVRFKVYTPANTSELNSSRITAMATDTDGKLWIGTERGEILCYKDGKFKLIDDGSKDEHKSVVEMFADNNGEVWIGVGKKIKICVGEQCKNTHFNDGIRTIRKDKNGIVWIITEGKLAKFFDEKYDFDGKVTDELISIEANPNGGLWIVKKDEFGIYRNGIYQTKGKFPKPVNYVGTFVKPDGTLLISFNVFIYEVSETSAKDFEIYEITNVSGVTMRDIFVDREGIIWVGRVGDGLVRLLERRVKHLLLDSEFSFTAANSLAEDAQENIWITTNYGLFRGTEEKIEKISKEVKKQNYPRGAMLIDSQGTMWTGTTEGLQSYKDGEFKFHCEISWEKAQSGNSLFEDKRKNLWYGCEDCGVLVSDGEKIIARYTTENGLAGNSVNVIHESPDGSMWFGTRSGISYFKDGEFTNYKSENGLSNEYVRDVFEDKDGTLWFGTYGGGLNRFKDGEFISITTKNGLFDDIVSRILIDDEDNFWMLGNRGIYSVNRKMLNDFADGKIKQVYCGAYTTADGMLTSEGNGGYQGAGLRTRDGKLWFPMINGIVIIDPKQEKLSSPKPLIEEIFLNSVEIDTKDKKVEINPGNESLEINYTGIGFRKPDQIQFRYRLAGLDENWTDAGSRRIANYSYLPSGNYRFQLRAANADGVWSEQIAEFEIVVFPPFWKTWWFFTLACLVVILALYATYEYRNWYFAREKAVREEFARRLLNAQEQERRRIASEIHDNLGQQLLIIKNFAAYCLNKTSKKSKIQEQIFQISETADEALNEVRSMAKNLSPYHLDKVGLTSTISYMLKHVDESCEIEFQTEIDNVDGVLPKEDEINLYRIVQESVNNIVKHSQAEVAKVSLKKRANILILKITDNGNGFQQSESDYQKLGMGLNGITERTKMLGGNLNIKSIPKKGTEIVLELPIR